MSNLILRNDAALTISFTKEAEEMKEAALVAAAPISKVTNPTELETATEAAKKLATVSRAVEKARKAHKEPVLDYGRQIDAKARGFVEEICAEELRVNTIIGDYVTEQQILQRRREAEAQAEADKIAAAERAALAKAKTPEAVQTIQERAAQEREAVAPPPPPPQPKGLTVKTEIDFQVTDIWKLAQLHPGLVTITEKRGEIKSLINSGHKIAGIRTFEVTKTGVRTAKRAEVMDV